MENLKTRKYNRLAINNGAEYIIPINTDNDTNGLRKEFYYHSGKTCLWAKEIKGNVFYSYDHFFKTEKEDATHIVIFIN